MSLSKNEEKPTNDVVREDILKLLNENTSPDTNLLSKLKEYLNKHDPEYGKKEDNMLSQGVTAESESNQEASTDNDKQNKEKKKSPIFKEENGNEENVNKENTFLKRKRKNNNKEDSNDSNGNNSENLPSYLKLNELVKKYGITNILKTLYKPNFDLSKSLDKNLQKIIDSQGTQKLTFMLLNIHCTNNKCEINNDSKTNVNLEEDDNNTNKENKKDSNHSFSQPPPNKNQRKQNDEPNLNNTDNKNEIIDKNEEDNDEVKIDLDEKNQDSQKGANNNNNSSRFRKELGLGVHFHKDDEDNIYKYCLHHFLGETRAIFYCSDKQCKSVAKYDVDTKVFTITVEHSKAHSQHNYILNFDSEKKDKVIFLDFKKKNYKEGQVFRKGEGKRIVQWYNC